MLFNFTLDSIEEIEPWGEPPLHSLSWFGLSAGTYHIKAGAHELFRYSDACVEYLAEKAGESEITPYVDYYVARLYEDILSILPYTLEPVPDFLLKYIKQEMDPENPWHKVCDDWLSRYVDQETDDDDVWDTFYNATIWTEERYLDTGYLSPAANIQIWSDNRTITLEWNNSEKKIHDIPAWSTEKWRFTLSREQYLQEVKSFHDRFITAMGERIAAVARNWQNPEIEIDTDALQNEHQFREQQVNDETLHIQTETDWETVMQAIERIDSEMK